VLGPSEGGLGGQDAPDGFPASGCNAYPSGANAFFADASTKVWITFKPVVGQRRDRVRWNPPVVGNRVV